MSLRTSANRYAKALFDVALQERPTSTKSIVICRRSSP